jgi:hypothetical protein
MIKATPDAAMKASGQNVVPAPDPRSPQQQLHDHWRGVEAGTLPRHLADLLATSEPADPKLTEAHISSMGRDYKAMIAEAQAALVHAKSDLDPTKLSAAALLQLAFAWSMVGTVGIKPRGGSMTMPTFIDHGGNRRGRPYRNASTIITEMSANAASRARQTQR